MSIRKGFVFIAALLFLFFLFMTWRWFDLNAMLLQLSTLGKHPQWLILMIGAYWCSFVLKACAWKMYSGSDARFRIYYHGIMYSLLTNHLLPIKVGDIARAGFLMRNSRNTWDEAVHSVAIMRLIDMFVLGAVSVIGVLSIGLLASWTWIFLLFLGIVFLLILLRLTPIHRKPFVQKHWLHFKSIMLSRRGLRVLMLISVSWILEAGVIYGIAVISKLGLGAISLVWANSVTIAGQVLHITPGGIGTYESTLSGSLAVLGVGWEEAYAAALGSHAFKFVFSYVAGGYTLMRMPIGWREMKEWRSQKQKLSKEGTS